MKQLIACCGLDCEKCEARIATLNDDDRLREKVAKEWGEMNQMVFQPEWINCVGCRTEGCKTFYCSDMCKIRQCAMNKGYYYCPLNTTIPIPTHCNRVVGILLCT